MEKNMTESGIVLLKYWLEVSPGEPARQQPHGYTQPDRPLRYIPTPF